MKTCYKLVVFFLFFSVAFGKTFYLGVSALPENFNPYKHWHYLHVEVFKPAIRTLVSVNEEGLIRSNIANAWSTSLDGKTYRFYIKRGIKLDNGKIINARFVAKNLNYLLKNKDKYLFGKIVLSLIKTSHNIILIDDYTLELKILKPYPPFLKSLATINFSILDTLHKEKIVSTGLSKYIIIDHQNVQLLPRSAKAINTININYTDEISEIENNLSMGKYDYLLGYSEQELDAKSWKKHYNVSSLQNLGVLHLFLNSNVFRNLDFRRDLSLLIQSKFLTKKYENIYLKSLNTYLPKGIMPLEYYDRQHDPISVQTFIRKWKNKIPKRKIRIYLRKEYNEPSFANDFKSLMTDIGLNVEVNILSVKNLLPIVKTKQYDILQIGYFSHIDDPDGFISIIDNKNPLKMGVYDSSEFSKEIRIVRFHQDEFVRLQNISRVFKKFENKHFIVPMYRLSFPIFYKKDQTIHRNDYQYANLISDLIQK